MTREPEDAGLSDIVRFKIHLAIWTAAVVGALNKPGYPAEEHRIFHCRWKVIFENAEALLSDRSPEAPTRLKRLEARLTECGKDVLRFMPGGLRPFGPKPQNEENL